MPEDEPRVGDADVAPGTDPVAPEPEQSTLFSTADAPTTEAVVEGAVAETQADDWDEPEAGPSAEPAPDPEPEDEAEPGAEAGDEPEPEPEAGDEPEAGEELPPETAGPDAFATGVLEIVSSLDDSGTAAATTAAEAEATAIETAVPDAEVPSETPTDDITPPQESTVLPAASEMPASSALTPADEAQLPRARVPWWPFAVYLGLWVVALGYAAYRFMQVPQGRPLYEQALYGYFVIGGLVLTALGPVLIPFVWLLARIGSEKSQRGGLFARTAFWAALATLLGVGMWWLTIIVLDTVRLGSAL